MADPAAVTALVAMIVDAMWANLEGGRPRTSPVWQPLAACRHRLAQLARDGSYAWPDVRVAYNLDAWDKLDALTVHVPGVTVVAL
jgi:hypothetical protein